MADIDVSAEVVAQVCRNLTDDRRVTGYDRWFIVSLLEALSAKLAEAERDQATLDRILGVMGIADSDLDPVYHLEAVYASRDSTLAELAESREDNAWRPIESAPKGDEIFMAATGDGRIMIFRGNILANMMLRSTPDHLQFPAVGWRPLPAPPSDKGGGE